MGSEVLVALVLGLTGSLGHCFGMCGGISLMLGISQREEPGGLDKRVLWANLGRVTTYALLGVGAGVVGGVFTLALPGLNIVQGAFAILGAALAAYTALALLGLVTSPDVLLRSLTGRWGRMMRDTASAAAGLPYMTGLVWGLLPCGLVMLALVGAVATSSPISGALVMAAFGVGTIPAMLSVGAVSRALKPSQSSGRASIWSVVAVGVILVFGAQMALRGLAVWGLVDHARAGSLVLW